MARVGLPPSDGSLELLLLDAGQGAFHWVRSPHEEVSGGVLFDCGTMQEGEGGRENPNMGQTDHRGEGGVCGRQDDLQGAHGGGWAGGVRGHVLQLEVGTACPGVLVGGA